MSFIGAFLGAQLGSTSSTHTVIKKVKVREINNLYLEDLEYKVKYKIIGKEGEVYIIEDKDLTEFEITEEEIKKEKYNKNIGKWFYEPVKKWRITKKGRENGK